eukprot:170274_1
MSSATAESLSKRTEAYATFEVVSSLIFGFCVSVLFGNVNHDAFIDYFILEVLFIITMTTALILSAYSLIVISMCGYFVNRYMADSKIVVAREYLNMYSTDRKYARWSFYVSIVLLIISLAIYLFPQLSISTAIISLSILLVGAMFVLWTMYRMLNPEKIVANMRKAVNPQVNPDIYMVNPREFLAATLNQRELYGAPTQVKAVNPGGMNPSDFMATTKFGASTKVKAVNPGGMNPINELEQKIDSENKILADGNYRLVAAHSHKSLDVEGDSK